MYIQFFELIKNRVSAKFVLKEAVYNEALLYIWIIDIPTKYFLVICWHCKPLCDDRFVPVHCGIVKPMAIAKDVTPQTNNSNCIDKSP